MARGCHARRVLSISSDGLAPVPDRAPPPAARTGGFLLYGAAVKAARDPCFYGDLGVPDTLDGRFDLVALFAALVIERLRTAPAPGPDLAQAVFDAMFSDMDVTLRELGVGDLSVGKKVRAMWEAFHGRALSYGPALQAGDEAALADALARNVWRGKPASDRGAGRAGAPRAAGSRRAGGAEPCRAGAGQHRFFRAMSRPELSRVVRLDRIGQHATQHEVVASPEERAALARRFDIPGIVSLTCRFHPAPWPRCIGDRGRLAGCVRHPRVRRQPGGVRYAGARSLPATFRA